MDICNAAEQKKMNIVIVGHVDHGKSTSDCGSGFVTGHGLVALVGAIGIAGKHAAGGKLADRIIGPVIHGNIHERIDIGKRRSCEGHKRDYCNKRKNLFHCVLTPLVCVFFYFADLPVLRFGGSG